jgi:exopolyphosphatase/guanosine-5'-triphosphate,3'-diphosphate pyrophosphatase
MKKKPQNTELIASIDIGSNSVRLVVYKYLNYALLPVLNEKAICQLGKGLENSGVLHPQGVCDALKALEKFAIILKMHSVKKVVTVATAAVRDAKDGAAFLSEVKKFIKIDIDLISGASEASFAALGVKHSFQNVEGVVADMGGGSLEYSRVHGAEITNPISLPLGYFRLMDISNHNPAAAHNVLRQKLAERKSGLLNKEMLGGDLYLAGGGFRSIAKIHMAKRHYPLKILHNYEASADDMLKLCERLIGRNIFQLAKLEGLAEDRVDTIPYAAASLSALIQAINPPRIFFSANGLREGAILSSLLGVIPESSESDKLKDSVALSLKPTVNEQYAEQVINLFAQPLNEMCGVKTRLFEAAALFSEAFINGHPEYRAENAFLSVLRGQYVAANHYERAFIAACCYYRYRHKDSNNTLDEYKDLTASIDKRAARCVGLVLSIAYGLSGGNEKVLGKLSVEYQVGKEFVIGVPKDLMPLVSNGVIKKAAKLAEQLGVRVGII